MMYDKLVIVNHKETKKIINGQLQRMSFTSFNTEKSISCIFKKDYIFFVDASSF